MRKERIVPLIVAAALFMENMDATVIATSLPAIAADIGTSPLTLKLAITSYLLALAVFIPASGWMADRFGARRVFTSAIVVFMLGSIGCALAQTIEHFVIARTIEGIGGAMMTPVGRLVLLRSIDKRQLVAAMAWMTAPALIGPVVGPALGGFITTYFSWHFIFLINIPIGILGIVMAQRYIDPIKSDDIQPFDFKGFVLAGLGLGGIAFGLSVAGLKILPWPAVIAFIVGGAICHDALPAALQARRLPGAGLRPAAAEDHARGDHRRLPVPARHRRAAVPAAAAAAGRLRPDAVSVRPDHLRLGGRRAVHEDDRRPHHQDVRLPQRHGGRCARQRPPFWPSARCSRRPRRCR